MPPAARSQTGAARSNGRMHHPAPVLVGDAPLTVSDVVAVARDDAPVADHHHAVWNGLRPVTQSNGAATDGEGFGFHRRGRREQHGGEQARNHFTSPSPG